MFTVTFLREHSLLRKMLRTELYRTQNEFAAEISNQTVHGVMHLAWVDCDGGTY